MDGFGSRVEEGWEEGGGRGQQAATPKSSSEKPAGLVVALGPDVWRTLIWADGRVAQLDAREITGSGEKGL